LAEADGDPCDKSTAIWLNEDREDVERQSSLSIPYSWGNRFGQARFEAGARTGMDFCTISNVGKWLNPWSNSIPPMGGGLDF
jgi:hypothetical protein